MQGIPVGCLLNDKSVTDKFGILHKKVLREGFKMCLHLLTGIIMDCFYTSVIFSVFVGEVVLTGSFDGRC